eukprot:786400-Amphidinium_carterae.1
MGLPNPIIGRNASGRSAPMMGRSKQCHAEPCHEDHYMDSATSRHEVHRVEPARMVTTEWDTPNPIIGRSVSGRLGPDRRDVDRVEHHADMNVPTRPSRKRQRSDSSYSERNDAEIEMQDLRSQLAKERRRNQELEAMAE